MRDMTREEFLDWAKERALVELNNNGVNNCFNSFASDLKKHPETQDMDLSIMMGLVMNGLLSDVESMTKFINKFN